MKHAKGTIAGREYSLCGLACDAHESGDTDEPVEFAEAGELVTCVECRDAIDHVRASFKRYRAA
ncbi:hypothetical protein [Ralstonia sp. ASV6]|uniref:hypothetical protein n=1 Tax=Ralstonia sp. ASV6 TaxID=2795124 RepID=UPI0018EB7816|nr:hypothetical protein [Ralstonia sp. ASV6]